MAAILSSTSRTILCGDIGGTNSRLRLYEVDSNGAVIEKGNRGYENEHHPSLLAVIQIFLNEFGGGSVPYAACIAVAGPVSRQVANLTNRGHWRIDGEELAAALGVQRVQIINDFVAMGYGLLTLNHETECIKLHGPDAPSRSDPAPIACIGAGTGLGECYLAPLGNGKYGCYPSEGGHAEFAPRTELEIEMLHYLREKFESKHRISVERVVSGPGLVNIYEFLCHHFPCTSKKEVQDQVSNASDADRGKVIATNALGENPDKLCVQAMHLFTTSYGSEAGVAMLKWMPTGGLYLTGGLTAKNIKYITGEQPGTEGMFMNAMLDKGRVSPMLNDIPVYAVIVQDLGERGARYVALQLLEEIS